MLGVKSSNFWNEKNIEINLFLSLFPVKKKNIFAKRDKEGFQLSISQEYLYHEIHLYTLYAYAYR